MLVVLAFIIMGLAIWSGIHRHQNVVKNPLEFAVIGDHGDINNMRNADINFDGMNALFGTDEVNPEFFVALGDNIYDNGMSSIDDPAFYSMMDLFESRDNLKDLEIYPVLGNHDCRGSVKAMLDASKLDNKWEIHSRYYSHSYDIDKSRPGDELGIVFLDGCQLCCIEDARSVFCNDNSEPPTEEQINAHYQWLDKTLAKMSKTLWKVLLIHFPIYSSTNMEWNQKSMI